MKTGNNFYTDFKVTNFVCIVRSILESFSAVLFKLIYWKDSEKLPAITDSLVTESATVLAKKIRSKQVKCETVLQKYISRIDDVNPYINALIEDNFRDAVREAKEIDKQLSDNKMSVEELAESKPLLGVPFTVKDSIRVSGFKIACGLYSRKDVVSKYDSDVVKLMKEAGAIFLGVTNVPELCMWWESANTIYGRTNNPYDFRRTAGGSSGGEGSLLSSCGTPMGIGTDIGGSIRMPSFFNGIFGHKPSPGIVSQVGKFPATPASYEDISVVGPMTRHAADLKLMMKVLAGPKRKLLALDKEVNLKSVKVFYLDGELGDPWVSGVDPEVSEAVIRVASHLGAVCGTKPAKVRLTDLSRSVPLFLARLSAGDDVPSFWSEMTGNKEKNIWVELVKNILGFGKHTFSAMAYSVLSSVSRKRCPPENLQALLSMKEELRIQLGNDGVLVFPTHPMPAPYHYKPAFHPFNCVYTCLFNALEVPATSCPVGLSRRDSLPLGVQIVANRNNDHLCFAVAEEIERAFGGWVNPSVVAT